MMNSTHSYQDCQTNTFSKTLVVNHDTQPGSAVYTEIAGWFKSLAYCAILLRDAGYPSIFYGDLYGTKGEHSEPPACGDKLADMVLARYLYAYGEQNDYFEEKNCIGFVRRGTWDKPDGKYRRKFNWQHLLMSFRFGMCNVKCSRKSTSHVCG